MKNKILKAIWCYSPTQMIGLEITLMKISEESARHLDTAILLMEGVKESLSAEPDKWGCIPPEHSRESIHRRCVQARQELLQVQKALR